MPAELISSKVRFKEGAPTKRALAGRPTSISGFLGITEKGPLTPQRIRDFEQYKRIFGGYIAEGEITNSVAGFFENGGGEVWVARTMHYTDITDIDTATGVVASENLVTPGAATQAVLTGTQAAPFVLDPGMTLVVDVDSNGDLTATFLAVQAALISVNSETYALSDSETLLIKADNGLTQTVTFLTADFVAIGAATALEVAAKINTVLTGGSARVNTAAVELRSDTYGTASAIQVTGGTANVALAFATVAEVGTGNVADIKAVTVAEVKTVAEAAVADLSVVSGTGGVAELRSVNTGIAATVEVDATSTGAAAIGLAVDTPAAGSDSGSASAILVEGKYLGAYGNGVTVEVLAATSSVAEEFNLSVVHDGGTSEVWPNLDPDPAGARYFETIVNNERTGSQLVTLTDLGLALSPRPQAQSITLSGGDDGLTGLADTDFSGNAAGRTGLHAFATVDDDLIFAVPDRATVALHNALLAYVETTRDGKGFAILDPPADMDADAIADYTYTTAGLTGLSEFGAIYWPRTKIVNPKPSIFGTDAEITVPPSGQIAGMFARVDSARAGGVYDAPAGVDRGVLLGVVGLESDEAFEEGKRDIVANRAVNPLNRKTATAFYVDGVDVLRRDYNFPTVSERRGVNFLKSTMDVGLQSYRFDNNDARLRAEVDRTLTGFLTEQMNLGAFRTKDPEFAFSVDVSDDVNDVFANKLVVNLTLATAKPAIWIDVALTQDVRQLQ